MSSARPQETGLGHVPALDGLRGLALLGVLAFHADGALRGGYLGVDLFFVLSGFLITALMLAEHAATGAIDLRRFWLRRARRLLPALLLLLVVVVPAARYLGPAAEFATIRGDALATLGYVANWRQVFAARDYWALFRAPSPLEHMWSLAIEEQVYVLWPVVVLLALRAGGRRGLGALTTALALGSAAAMYWLFHPAHSSRAYYGTDTRAGAILAGALLALAAPRRPWTPSARALRALDALGLAALGFTALAWTRLAGGSARLYRGGFWLTELAALALIACALAGRRSVVARLLALGPLRLLGLVSYGAYLWHWPVHVYLTSARARVHGPALELLRLGVTLGLAALSYRYLEKPIRERRLAPGRPVRLFAASVAGLVFILAGATHARPGDARWRALASAPRGDTPVRLRVAVHGDSTANALGWVLVALGDPGVVVVHHGRDGLSLVRDPLPAWPARDADAAVVFLGGAFLHGIDFQDRWRMACHPEWHRRFDAALERWLADAGEGARRLWVATVPYPLEQFDTPDNRAWVDCINRSIRAVTAAHPPVRILELAEMLCPSGVCQRDAGEGAIRPDGVHYDPGASRQLGAAIVRALEQGPARPE